MRSGKEIRAVATLFVGLALSARFGVAQSRPGSVPAAPVPADHTLHYGSDPLQFGELRLPKVEGEVPVVIVVHGGCWAERLPGAHPLPDASLTQRLAAALASGGVATWNIEYRRTGGPGGGWPNTYLDLGEAVDYLRTIAPTYHLDLSKVFVVGHSSGGQLALWLGARSKLSKASPLYMEHPLALREIIDIDGPPDLTTAQPLESTFCPMPAITQFLEGTPAEKPGRYHDGSAQPLLPLNVPQIIFSAALLQHTGTLATQYQAAAAAKGDRVTILPLESNHFAMLDPLREPGKAVIDVILAAVNARR